MTFLTPGAGQSGSTARRLISTRKPAICMALAALFAHAAASLAQPAAPPKNTQESCIEQWRASRGVAGAELSSQTAAKFIGLLALKVPDAVSLADGCERIDIVLDKVRSDAAGHASGLADLVIGKGDKQVIFPVEFVESNYGLTVTGDAVHLVALSKQGPLDGKVTIENKERTLKTTPLETTTMKNVAVSRGESGDTAELLGTLTKTPKGLEKNGQFELVKKSETRGQPMEMYLLSNLPSTGAQSCAGPNCGGVVDTVIQDLVNWSSGIYTAATGYLAFDFVSPPNPEIQVDDSVLPALQKEWPVRANTEHVVKASQGATKWQATVKVQKGETIHCPSLRCPS
jgi:hypothetical protein